MTMEMARAPETKSALDHEVKDAFDDFMSSFEAFRQANDTRMGEIETRMSADVLSTEKVERINKALDDQKRKLDELLLKQVRPALGGSGRQASEHGEAFAAYMRSGDDRGMRGLEAKAMSAGTGSDGGYLVPEETETEIGRRLVALSPIRSIAAVRQVSGAVLKKPFALTGPATGWVGETAARTQTASPTLAELEFPAAEIYAMPSATQALLDDSAIDIDRWLTDEIELAFAEQEGAAFVSGNGVNKPKGFLAYDQVAEGSWSWGNIGTLASGAAGGFPTEAPADRLIDLIYALKAGYRENGRFVMNRKTQAALRRIKDGHGNYLWLPPAAAGARATLMGFPVVEAEDMPDIAANATPIAFGDFNRGYLVVDRTGVRVLRDPYSAKPYILFYVTKRVGGGVQDFNAIKLLRIAAS